MTRIGIVVGIDDSLRARNAVLWAVDECQLRRCSLLIVCAAETGTLATDETTIRACERAADQVLTAQAVLASARQPTVAVATLLIRTEPEEALVRLSAAAVMLVVHPTQRWSQTASSRWVAAHARCPVALISDRPAGTARRARIIVATATGPSGRRTRAFARDEALVHSATTHIVVGSDAAETVLHESAHDELAVIGVRQADSLWRSGSDPNAVGLMPRPPCPVLLVPDSTQDMSERGIVSQRSAI